MPGYRLHDRLGYRVSRLARIMQSRLEGLLADDGLSRMMWLVLTGIGEDGVRTPSQMADYIGITRPAASRLLARMEALGHVARGPAEGDGRAVGLALTSRGRETLGRLRPRVDEMTRAFEERLDPGMRATVMEGLARLAEGDHAPFDSL